MPLLGLTGFRVKPGVARRTKANKVLKFQSAIPAFNKLNIMVHDASTNKAPILPTLLAQRILVELHQPKLDPRIRVIERLGFPIPLEPIVHTMTVRIRPGFPAEALRSIGRDTVGHYFDLVFTG